MALCHLENTIPQLQTLVKDGIVKPPLYCLDQGSLLSSDA